MHQERQAARDCGKGMGKHGHDKHRESRSHGHCYRQCWRSSRCGRSVSGSGQWHALQAGAGARCGGGPGQQRRSSRPPPWRRSRGPYLGDPWASRARAPCSCPPAARGPRQRTKSEQQDAARAHTALGPVLHLNRAGRAAAHELYSPSCAPEARQAWQRVRCEQCACDEARSRAARQVHAQGEMDSQVSIWTLPIHVPADKLRRMGAPFLAVFLR